MLGGGNRRHLGPRLWAAVAGLAAGALGLAVGIALTALLRLRVSPVYAVAEAVIEVTPGSLAVDLVHLFGRWDKPLLVGGTVTLLALLAALAGVLARGSARNGQLVVAVLALVGLAAAITRPGAGWVDGVPVIIGWGVWALALTWLVDAVPRSAHVLATHGPDPPPSVVAATRRTLLLRGGAVLGAAAVLGVIGRFVGRGRREVERARQRLRLAVSRGEVPEGADIGLEEQPPWRTPNDDFYRIDTALVVPTVDVDTWRLRIHGMVEQELELTYQDLLDRELTEAWVTLCCVSNQVGGNLIGNAWWSGVRIADLFAEARPLDGADAVKQTSEDGWNCGTPLSVLTDDRDAMLAVAMNGEPLPLEHGFPVRMVVPGLYGYVSATKWLVDLEVTRFSDFTAFWTQRGWSAEGPIKTQSRIDVPRGNHRVTAGQVRVAGVAWAQHTGIEGVEVQLDGGPWQPVDLARVPSVDTWVQWVGRLDVDPGVHRLAVRATDRSGQTQTGVRTDVVPDGATGWHTIEFTAE